MKCPHCGTNDKHPVERTKAVGGSTRRTRRCYTCSKTFNTMEVVWPDSDAPLKANETPDH